jgi:hypothetical protein
LEGLGFERALVIEAFFACDKNEGIVIDNVYKNVVRKFEFFLS